MLKSFASLVMAMVGGVALLFGIPAMLISIFISDPAVEQARPAILLFTAGGAVLFVIGLLGQIVGRKKWKALMAQAVPSPHRSELTWYGFTGKTGLRGMYDLAVTGSCAYCGRETKRMHRATQRFMPEKYNWLFVIGVLPALAGIPLAWLTYAMLQERTRTKLGIPNGVRGVALRYPACRSCRPKLTWAWLGLGMTFSVLPMLTSGALHSPTPWQMMGVFGLIEGGLCIAMAGAMTSQKMHPFRIAFQPETILVEGPEHLSIG